MNISIKTLAAVSITACVTMASCKEESNTSLIQASVTITGDLSNGYTLYQDNGGIIVPTYESARTVTNGAGFTKERAIVYYSYTDDDIKDCENGKKIEGANLLTGEYMRIYDLITAQEVTEKSINATDSVFDVTQVSNIWCYRGYFNALVFAPYSILNGALVSPTIHAAYDPTAMSENALDLTLYYNRHTSKETNSSAAYDFYCTFPIYKIADQIPGNDSVTITFRVSGCSPASMKISRDNLTKGNYLPFQ